MLNVHRVNQKDPSVWNLNVQSVPNHLSLNESPIPEYPILIWITLTSCSSGGVYSAPGHKAAAMKPLVFPHCPLCELHRCWLAGWTSTVLNISSRHNIWLHKKVGDLPWGRQTYSNHPRQTKCWWSLFIVQISIRPCSPHSRIRNGWKTI